MLQLVSALGGQTGRLLVAVGCRKPAIGQPDQEGNLGLSAPVFAAIGEAVHMVEELITRERSSARLPSQEGRLWPENSEVGHCGDSAVRSLLFSGDIQRYVKMKMM